MFEYTTRLDGSTVWACYTEEPLYIEVNITGITDETEIQNKLSLVLETVKDFDN